MRILSLNIFRHVDERKVHDIQRLILPPLSLKVEGKDVPCIVIEKVLYSFNLIMDMPAYLCVYVFVLFRHL
jgi:hypothetical protein